MKSKITTHDLWCIWNDPDYRNHKEEAGKELYSRAQRYEPAPRWTSKERGVFVVWLDKVLPRRFRIIERGAWGISNEA